MGFYVVNLKSYMCGLRRCNGYNIAQRLQHRHNTRKGGGQGNSLTPMSTVSVGGHLTTVAVMAAWTAWAVSAAHTAYRRKGEWSALLRDVDACDHPRITRHRGVIVVIGDAVFVLWNDTLWEATRREGLRVFSPVALSALLLNREGRRMSPLLALDTVDGALVDCRGEAREWARSAATEERLRLSACACTIQKAWRRAITDPGRAVCRIRYSHN